MHGAFALPSSSLRGTTAVAPWDDFIWRENTDVVFGVLSSWLMLVRKSPRDFLQSTLHST